ncbi:hypothetical protein ACH4OY_06705 [Micromonospora rubida]|uniref:Secreted protein n=1 Tax=Micromonospora rubida TaxID=2697657 RepID=A0ABW7SFB5_9ACTN
MIAALAALAMLGLAAPPASAAPADGVAQAVTRPVKAQPHVSPEQHDEATNQARRAARPKITAPPARMGTSAACWTTFNPSNPQGGPMDQTYKNCGTSTVWVTVGYGLGNSRYAYIGYCASVQPGQEVTWNLSSTAPNSSYVTMICESWTLSTGVATDVPCYTTFVPGSPQGDPMDQYYRNCGSGTYQVLPGYYKGNTYHAFVNNSWTVGVQGKVWWAYPHTELGAQYETMFAI